MSKRNIAKIGGFIGMIGASAALVAAAAGGTGAYFTDSKDGSINGNTGHLTLSTTDANLSFTDLVPGTSKTKDINYNVDTTGPSDVWLVFDPTKAEYQSFTGAKGSPLAVNGGLGRFGHFAVSNDSGGPLFQSYNLAHVAAGGCVVDTNGRGGSNQQSTSADIADAPPQCGVPSAILVASNLTTGQGGTMHLTFGVTGRWTSGKDRAGQNATLGSVPFKLVATQAGHRPDAANF